MGIKQQLGIFRNSLELSWKLPKFKLGKKNIEKNYLESEKLVIISLWRVCQWKNVEGHSCWEQNWIVKSRAIFVLYAREVGWLPHQSPWPLLKELCARVTEISLLKMVGPSQSRQIRPSHCSIKWTMLSEEGVQRPRWQCPILSP